MSSTDLGRAGSEALLGHGRAAARALALVSTADAESAPEAARGRMPLPALANLQSSTAAAVPAPIEADTPAGLRAGTPGLATDMLTAVRFEGRTSQFYVPNELDQIQSCHARGQYFESCQLIRHRDLICSKSTVVDIGSNVGNHAIFYAKHTRAANVYVFEPNPVARLILEANVAANPDCSGKIRQTYLAFAIGKASAHFRVLQGPENNLGQTKLLPCSATEPGAVQCRRLDELDLAGPVSFLKIDVPGMEMDVLAGAQAILAKFRPAIAIEVGIRRESAFWSWARAFRYRVIHAFFEYSQVKSYIVIPES